MLNEPIRVAMVDDNLFFTAALETALRRAGHEPAVFPPGEGGLARLAAFRPQVVLVSLAGADPAGRVRSLKEQPALAEATIVAYAGHLETERIQAARAAGADLVVAHSALMGDPAAVIRRAGRRE